MPEKQDITVLTKIVDMNYKEIGQFIKEKRELANLSQESLAKSVGISSRSIINIENGVKTRETTISKVLNKLGFKLEKEYKISLK